MQVMTSTQTERGRAKADRRAALLTAGAQLFAAHGFAAVTVDDLGTAVGVSGPAVYRHFASKQALLDEVLVDVSQRLRDGGIAAAERANDPASLLRDLVAFHVRFALSEPDVIRVQDRDLAELSEAAMQDVRAAQRAYIAQWATVLTECLPLTEQAARLRVRAVFGLMNSTPHSARTASELTSSELQHIALAALLAHVSA